MSEEEYKVPERYEPPSLKLIMELLRILSANGKVSMTITLEAKQDGQ